MGFSEVHDPKTAMFKPKTAAGSSIIEKCQYDNKENYIGN